MLSKSQFLLFGLISILDEAEMLAPKFNLIAKRFGIPLEQRPSQYGKFERVDAIRLE